jgi:hypothetical protein
MCFRFRRSRAFAHCTFTGILWEQCRILLWDKMWNKNSESLGQYITSLDTVGACEKPMCVLSALAVAATHTLQAILMVVGKGKPAQVWKSFPQAESGWNQRSCTSALCYAASWQSRRHDFLFRCCFGTFLFNSHHMFWIMRSLSGNCFSN